MDIVPSPRSLGLGKYEAAFRENEITENVLPNLTAEDLKELGVAALRPYVARCHNGAFRSRCGHSVCPERLSRRPFFGLGGLNGAFGANGPRGFARGHLAHEK
jgi:hypothetical protein